MLKAHLAFNKLKKYIPFHQSFWLSDVVNLHPYRLACGMGSYSPVPASERCTPCVPGYYQDQVGATKCEPCPPATYLPSDRATSAADCIKCPTGSYGGSNGKAVQVEHMRLTLG